jgi:hypothetical protein
VLDAGTDDSGPALPKGADRYLLAGVDHLGAAKAAAALDVSGRTILRFRAALRALREAS